MFAAMTRKLFQFPSLETWSMTRNRRHRLVSSRPSVEMLEDRNLLSTCTVDRLTDLGQGSEQAGDLRYCVINAANGDVIQFGVTGTIGLTRPLPALNPNLTITGPGADKLTVKRDSTGAFRVFNVAAGTTVGMSGLTIANGSETQGGGILNSGTLTVTDMAFRANAANSGQGASGGAIDNEGTLTVSGSTFSGNSSTGGNGFFTGSSIGGGISNAPGKVLTVSGSTFSGNTTSGSGGGIYSAGPLTISGGTFSGNTASGSSGSGGGIYSEGTLTVSGSTFSGNSSKGTGGGIASKNGKTDISSSTFSGNTASGSGGGIYNQRGSFFGGSAGNMTIRGSTFTGNSAGDGGGISSSATYGNTAAIDSSTFSGNTAASSGGAIGNGGTLTINNSTIFGNSTTNTPGFFSSASGGGIYNNGTLDVSNSTLSGNSTKGGGGGLTAGGTTRTRNSILAGNTAAQGPDLSGRLSSQGYNLIQNPAGGSGFDSKDWLGLDPLLGPLQDNGGPTKTMTLLPGSPAAGAGDPTQLGVADQRGVIRTGGVDIGAYQASASGFVLTTPDKITAGTPFVVTVKAVDSFKQTAAGYTGTVRFTSTDPYGATLPADYTFTAADGGVHAFTLTSGREGGTFTLTVTDPRSGASGSATIATSDGTLTISLTTFQAIAGAAFTGVVASLRDSDPNGTAGDFTATVDWGDGRTTAGTVADDGQGGFTVTSSHTYAAAGSYSFAVTVQDAGGASSKANGAVSVASVASPPPVVTDGPLKATGLDAVATEGVAFSGSVASFTDANSAATARQFTASISWGDGQVSAGTVADDGHGVFNVTGSHTYAKEGPYTVAVAVTGAGDAKATAGSTVHVARFGPPPANLLGVANALSASAEYFRNLVTGIYQRYLGRGPDPTGLAAWVTLLQGSLTDEQLEAGFIGSPEYIQNHGGTGENWVRGMYHDLLGRAPDAAGLNAWLTQLRQGVSPAAIALGFAASAEREGQRVAEDYQRYLGRAPAAAEVSLWVDLFVNQGARNEQVIGGFVGSPEYFQRHYGNARDWLFSAYQDILGRPPEAAGANTWLGSLGFPA
jgi:predicted outer membrane repeat protein